MGGNEIQMVKEVLAGARKELKGAIETLSETPRPANACPAHDAQFAAVKAMNRGVDTLLMIQEKNLEVSETVAPEKERDDSEIVTPIGKLRGPVVQSLVKYAVIGAIVLAGVWMIINRNDAVTRAQINDSIKTVAPIIIKAAQEKMSVQE